MVLPGFAAAALRGEPLIVHGDGKQSRCFLHVSDCISAVLAVLDCPAAVGKVINIGSDEEVSILGLAQRVAAAAGSASPIRLMSYAEAFPEGGFADMRRRVPDVGRLRHLTGWRRTRDLERTIHDAVVWARG
jgi:UDP-glucose 4-epimerase